MRQIGLHDNEIRIYFSLLELDEATASELAQKSRINRTLAYHFLEKLMEKGLVSYVIKNNVKFFRAADPHKFLEFIREKESEIKSLIPLMLKLKRPKQDRPHIEVYEGFEGLKTVLNDVLNTKPKEWLDITPAISHVFLPTFLDNWEKQRAKMGIKGRVLIDRTPIGIKRARKLKKFGLIKVKFMPEGTFSPATVWIYANKVSITVWSKDFPIGILVENKEITNRFKWFFNWLWKMAD